MLHAHRLKATDISFAYSGEKRMRKKSFPHVLSLSTRFFHESLNIYEVASKTYHLALSVCVPYSHTLVVLCPPEIFQSATFHSSAGRITGQLIVLLQIDCGFALVQDRIM